MVRRAQMQKQMDISSTKADKLLKKAKKMNMINKKKFKIDDKKTAFPDLERLPDHDKLKHFLYVL